jgi:Adenylate and Guanylate cyclase catalytic domain
MNVASRMESTGVRDKIQLSVATAKLLIKAGKDHWIEKRDGKVDIKGKGSQETYFVRGADGNISAGSTAPTARTNISSSDGSDNAVVNFNIVNDKTTRLVDWNTDVLARHLIAIVNHQVSGGDSDLAKHEEINPTVMKKLHHFVEIIASMYNNNPFHNFSHASHVTLAMEKMLSRVERNSECMSGAYTNNICSDPLAQFAAVLAALIHDCDRK